MLGLKSLAAAAAVAVLAVAGPALAGTMVFEINVTSATGVSGFTPTSFQETFTLGAGTLSASGPSFDFSGPVSGSTPLTAGLKSLVNLTGASDFSNYDFGGFHTNTEGDIFENLSGANGSYQQSIDGGSSSTFTPGSKDAAGLAAFFAAQGTLSWYEKVNGPGFTPVAEYFGTATLVAPSAAPEPSAWALMLLGVGGLGAMLRRRGRAVLA